MTAHSRFGASGAHRWMRCPGSVPATAGMPNPSSPAAAEGTMLHEVAASELEGLPHEYEITDEQREVVDQYINLVKAEKGDGKLLVETRFQLPINPQLGFYALGACAALGRTDWEDIELIVCQPRFGGIKRRATTYQELLALAEELVQAAAVAESNRPTFEAGSHCKFCLASATCPTLRGHVYELARMDFADDAA